MIDSNLNNKSTILITGGSGLVGKRLTSLLLSKGYKISHLSRKEDHIPGVKVYKWDPENGSIDPAAVEGVDYILHLAGANIGEKRWTKRRKAEIINSRVNTIKFLYNILIEKGIKPKAFISSSATGYYGAKTSERIFLEDDPPSADFLGTICSLWEEAADIFSKAGIRTVKIRTSVVLEKNNGALLKLIKPAKLGLVVRIGSGRQYMPWIHISDLCAIYLKAIEDQNIIGAYNAVSPHHINHNKFMKTLAEVMKKPVFLPPVPAFVLRIILGEMSDVVLKGSRVSSQKIIKTGFSFTFESLPDALNDLIMGK